MKKYGYMSMKAASKTKFFIDHYKIIDTDDNVDKLLNRLKCTIVNDVFNNSNRFYVFYKTNQYYAKVSYNTLIKYNLPHTIIHIINNSRTLIRMNRDRELTNMIYNKLDFLHVYNKYKSELLTINKKQLLDIYILTFDSSPLFISKQSLINCLLKYKRNEIIIN